MSDFEYTDLSCSNSHNSSDEDLVIPPISKLKTNTAHNIQKVRKEIQLNYSNLFIDTFYLIDLFVKSKGFSYDTFLSHFNSTNFHQIYAKPKKEVKHSSVTPHFYITTTLDAITIASKFLKASLEKARIGALYLLYTLYKTQPLNTYLFNVKMEPKDYKNTEKLVNEYLNKGVPYPAYCFYSLSMRKQITITAELINPCLEANYPRKEVRKHMCRVANNYFAVEYKERIVFDPLCSLQLMEQQMRSELMYINKQSTLILGHNIAPEYNAVLSIEWVEINNAKTPGKIEVQKIENNMLKKPRYKNKMNIAFPGKNEDILEDMVITAEAQKPTHPPKKKMKRRKIGQNKNKISEIPTIKEEHCSLSPRPISNNDEVSNLSSSSDENDDDSSKDDKYGEMIWRLLEGNGDNEFVGRPSDN